MNLVVEAGLEMVLMGILVQVVLTEVVVEVVVEALMVMGEVKILIPVILGQLVLDG